MEELRTNRLIKSMSAQKPKEYENATQCYICHHAFENNDLKGPKVCEYDHMTGLFIKLAHRKCNLERPVSFSIHIIFHNFRGYDEHLIFHQLGTRPEREIIVKGQNI